MEQYIVKNGFPPMTGDNPKILILGTLPGDESLRVGQYYANPRNMFWEIMQSALGTTMSLDYRSRCQTLKNHGIALWDVFTSVVRDGSLDSSIISSEHNDLEGFINEHPSICTIVLNGGKAYKAFRKYCKLHPTMRRDITTLPFTSTSRLSLTAGWTVEKIKEQWRGILL